MYHWEGGYDRSDLKSDYIDEIVDCYIDILEDIGYEWKSKIDELTEIATKVVECDINYEDSFTLVNELYNKGVHNVSNK